MVPSRLQVSAEVDSQWDTDSALRDQSPGVAPRHLRKSQHRRTQASHGTGRPPQGPQARTHGGCRPKVRREQQAGLEVSVENQRPGRTCLVNAKTPLVERFQVAERDLPEFGRRPADGTQMSMLDEREPIAFINEERFQKTAANWPTTGSSSPDSTTSAGSSSGAVALR